MHEELAGWSGVEAEGRCSVRHPGEGLARVQKAKGFGISTV